MEETGKEELFDRIELTGVDPKAVSRYVKIVQMMIAKGSLDIQNGKTILYWENGFLNRIDNNAVVLDTKINRAYNS